MLYGNLMIFNHMQNQFNVIQSNVSAELFKILKADAIKVLHSICQQIWKTQQQPQDWKMFVFIPIPKKGNAKECSNYHSITLISHVRKRVLNVLQLGFNSTYTKNLQLYQLNLEKAEEPDIKFPTNGGSQKNQGN